MSCTYAEGLSSYENKGVLGLPEVDNTIGMHSIIPRYFQKFENDEKVGEKCIVLADWISKAKHVVVHTGAGISTSAGIPDFRYLSYTYYT